MSTNFDLENVWIFSSLNDKMLAIGYTEIGTVE